MRILHTTLLALLLAPSIAMGEVWVIAHNSLDLSSDAAREAFVGEKQFAGSQRLQLVDNAATQKEFLDKVMKLDSAKYGAIWIKKGFRDGLNPPPVRSSDAEIVAFVKATPGAVGYVSTPVGAGIKIIGKF